MHLKYKIIISTGLTALLMFMLFSFNGCRKKKTALPEFKAVFNLKMTDFSKNNFDLTGDIVFENNTKENFKMTKVITDVMIDKADVATFLYRKPMALGEGKELVIPFKVTLDQNDLVAIDPLNMTVFFELKGKVEFENERKEIIEVRIMDQQKILLKDKKLNKQTKKEIRKQKKALKKNKEKNVPE